MDRGEHSCEIVFTIAAFALLYGGEERTSKGAGILINRGNHEAHNQVRRLSSTLKCPPTFELSTFLIYLGR